MKIIERIESLKHQETALMEKLKKELKAAEDKTICYDEDWRLCLHDHYEEIVVTAGLVEDESTETIKFAVSEGRIGLISTGKYAHNWKEAEKVLTRFFKDLQEQDVKIIERIESLKHQENAFREKLKKVFEAVNCEMTYDDKWVFCLHDHYQEPRISVWLGGQDCTKSIEFIVRDGQLNVINTGEYAENWQQGEEVLTRFLNLECTEQGDLK